MKRTFWNILGVNGWKYYVDSHIAWVPEYVNGSMIWMKRVWRSWPEDSNGPIMSPALGTEDKPQQMDICLYDHDPRITK